MTADDDPEQRIAELERPLLESAAASEPAGGTGIGLRIGWIVFGLLVAALAVSGVRMLADQADTPVAGRPTVPSMVGGGGSLTRSPAAPRPLPPPTFSPGGEAPIPAPSAPETPEGDVDVSGVGNERTIMCVDNAVSVSGVRNTVVLTGNCGRVNVSGVENTVIIDTADAIVVSGVKNKVTFLSGAPELTNGGIHNTLERG